MRRPHIWHNRCAVEVAVKRFLLRAGFFFFVVNLPFLAQVVQEPRRPADGGTSEVSYAVEMSPPCSSRTEALVPNTKHVVSLAAENVLFLTQLCRTCTEREHLIVKMGFQHYRPLIHSPTPK